MSMSSLPVTIFARSKLRADLAELSYGDVLLREFRVLLAQARLRRLRCLLPTIQSDTMFRLVELFEATYRLSTDRFLVQASQYALGTGMLRRASGTRNKLAFADYCPGISDCWIAEGGV